VNIGIQEVAGIIPEPGTYAMFLAGLGLLALVALQQPLRPTHGECRNNNDALTLNRPVNNICSYDDITKLSRSTTRTYAAKLKA